MNGFFKSFAPILKRLKRYLLEFILLSVALIIIVASFVIYIKNSQIQGETIASPIPTALQLSLDENKPSKIFVDVSGAVKNPGVYEVLYGIRIKNIIDKAGGLSDEADIEFYNRNFNLARIVSDQEKIYVPSVAEINSQIFTQNQRTLDYSSPAVVTINATKVAPSEIQSQISINSGTSEELDQLPGVGPATADKIIKNRPYSAIEDLVTKKVLSKSVFDKIKSLITY